MNTTLKPKIVAAIPCYNTAPFIPDIVSEAKKHVDQVIVIDDGSSDNTAGVAESAGATVKRHAMNGGYGAAIKSCFEMAKSHNADVLVILDGDGQHNADEIPAVIAPILAGEADIVVGSRFIHNCSSPKETLNHTQSTTNGMPGYRGFGIRVITFLWNFGSKTKVSDAQSGFRAYGTKVLPLISMSEDGMSGSIEILERARRAGAVIHEVPVSCAYTSTAINLKAVKHGIGVALAVLRIRLSRPGNGLTKSAA